MAPSSLFLKLWSAGGLGKHPFGAEYSMSSIVEQDVRHSWTRILKETLAMIAFQFLTNLALLIPIFLTGKYPTTYFWVK